MAIDISNRPPGGMRKIELGGKPQKRKAGFSYKFFIGIAAAAIIASGIISPFAFVIGNIFSRAAVPVICFLTAKVYEYSEKKLKTGIIIAVFTAVSHILYFYYYAFCMPAGYVVRYMTNQSFLIHTSSLMLPLLLGYAALYIKDTPRLEPMLKNVIIILLCIAAIFGEGGSFAAVCVFIFGSRYDKSTQIKCVCAAGLIMFAIDLIYGISYGTWLYSFAELGFLLFIPFITRYRATDGKLGKKYVCYALYPAAFMFNALFYYILLCTLWAARNYY